MTSLKKLRVDNCLSQKELAEMSGLSQATISRHEKKNRSMNIETAILLADALKVGVDEIIDRQYLSELGRRPQTGGSTKSNSPVIETTCKKCYLIHAVYIDCTNS